MVLSILRVLPVARIVFILVLAASFLAAGTARARAVEVREHKKTVPVQRSPKKRTPAKHNSEAHAPVHATAKSAAAHRRSPGHKTRIVRTSASVHSRSGKRVYRFSTRNALNHQRTHEVAARPHSFSVESASLDAPASNTRNASAPTAQDAANRIVDRENSAPHQAAATTVPEASAMSLYGGKIVAMAPLRGSLESLVRQNQKTDADNLERILNDEDLHNRIAQGALVPVPASSGLEVNPELPADRRYCRPWTATFLSDLAKAHEAQFHRSFEVSSAVRTVEFQKHLMRTNHNAAPAEGDVASPHLTGATIDIAKSGLTRKELYWMRNRLNALQSQGKIDVEEEFKQSCFHITVYKSYIGAEPPHKPRDRQLAEPPADDSDDAAPAAVASR